jgi:hypothetical protein
VVISGATGTVTVCGGGVGGVRIEGGTSTSNSLVGNGDVTNFFNGLSQSCNRPQRTDLSGALTIANNAGPFGVGFSHIHQCATATGNTAGGFIDNNVIDGNLKCSSNTPPVTASANTVAGTNSC